eukprot:jgi/Hompol1/5049/HPOL_001873-RA
MSDTQRLVALADARTQLPITAEELSYKRFVSVWSRTVKFPERYGLTERSRDAVGHGTNVPAFATVFPFNTTHKTVRILIEYQQGPNIMAYSLTAGGFDPRKHSSIEQTASSELSEEARLCGGTWVRLIPESVAGIPELKWSRNTFVPFLVLDPQEDTMPLDRDPEGILSLISLTLVPLENIQALDVSIDKLNELILNGLVMLPSVQTSLMAIDWLKRNKYLE